MSFRWGILGTGYVARKFVLGLRNAGVGTAEIVASRNPANAQAFIETFGGVRAAGSYEDAISATGIDAFYIATPPSEHRTLALQCIAAGKPVLIEKPFAMNAGEVAEVTNAARRASVFCMEGMWTRFLPLTRILKATIEAGEIGEVRSVTGSFGSAASPDLAPNLFSKRLGGGALLHRGVYPLSMACHLLGEPKAITSQARIGPNGVDEEVVVTATHASGGLSISQASLVGQQTNDLTVVGERGTIRVRAPIYRPFQMQLVRHASPTSGEMLIGRSEQMREAAWAQNANQRLSGLVDLVRGRKVRTIKAYYAGNGYRHEAEEVIACIRDGKTESALMPLEESRLIAEAMDRARAQWAQ